MDQEKQKTLEPASILGEDTTKQFAKAGRDLLDSSPGSFKTDVRQASMNLVDSTGKIVEAITVVIGAIQEQNKQQKENHEDERMMMGILGSELESTRSDNRATRRLIWVCIIISCALMIGQTYQIHNAQQMMERQLDSLEKTSASFNQLYAMANSTKADQQDIKNIIEQKPTVAIRATDDKGTAAIEVQQPVVTNGKLGFDVVHIPLKIKSGEIRASDDQRPAKVKSEVAKEVTQALRPHDLIAK